MRTSLKEIRKAEAFIAGGLEPSEALVYRAELMMSRRLRLNLTLQQKVYALIRSYGRKQLKEEIGEVQGRVFGDASFRETIELLF